MLSGRVVGGTEPEDVSADMNGLSSLPVKGVGGEEAEPRQERISVRLDGRWAAIRSGELSKVLTDCLDFLSMRVKEDERREGTGASSNFRSTEGSEHDRPRGGGS
jgi:hypothetical protein